MKCPLITIGYLASNRIDASRKCECGKEECALWEKEGEGCAFLLLGLRLGTICDLLTELVNKMPHAGQFKK